MSKLQTETENWSGRKYSKPEDRIMSEFELKQFDAEIEQYRIKRDITFRIKEGIVKKTFSYIDTEAWMNSRGAMRKDAIVITGFVSARYGFDGRLLDRSDCDPIKYERLEKDFDQWKDWKSRQNYGEKQRLSQWDEMRQYLVKNIEPEINYEEIPF